MKFNIINILLGVVFTLVAIVSMDRCGRDLDDSEVIDSDTTYVDKTIPEKKGKFKPIVPKPDTLIVEVENEETKRQLEYFKKQNDSLKNELYSKAITKNTYTETFEDDNIKVDFYAKSTGTLDTLSLSNYIIKEQTIKTPIITNTIKENKSMLYIGGEVGVPTVPNSRFLGKASIGFKDKKDRIFKVSLDTERRVWVGAAILF